MEDSYSKAERNFIYNLDKADFFKFPLIIKDLRKSIPSEGGYSESVPLRNLSLTIRKGEILSILFTDNRSAKILLKMLTGEAAPSRGNAWIAGFDIKH